MSTQISLLCSELKAALQQNTLTLPNSKVSAVQVDGFIKAVLGTENLVFTSATVTCDKSTVTLKGNFRLFGIELSANWGFTSENNDTITWRFGASSTDASTITSITDHFLSTKYNIPSNLSGLDVRNIGFEAKINKGDKDYSLDLNAKTSWGDLGLFVQNNAGVWGAALGIGISKGFTLSKIDRELSVFDVLTFSDSAIVISDFKSASLKIAGITGVIDGVEFKSTLSLNSTNGSSALAKIANELTKSLDDIPIAITIDLTVTRDYEITAAIEKAFNLPGFSSIKLSDIEMTIQSSPIAVTLSGDVSLPITIPASPTVHTIDVTGGVFFTYADGTGTVEAVLNSDTVIVDPFKFPGVTLDDVGVGLDVSFGVETGVGVTLEGAFLLGQKKLKLDNKFAITMEFTDDVPNPSLLYCETGNLTLAVIFDSIFDTGIKLPSLLSDFRFNDIAFYWCDKAQLLPDGTACQPGIGFNASVDFWGFDTYGALKINQGTGITGEASIDPIHLFNNNISITGNGKAGLGIKSGGAYFNFDTTKEAFGVSLDVDILGIKKSVTGTVSPTSLKATVATDLSFFKDSLQVDFENGGTTMSFDSSFSIGIDCKPTIKLGGIDLGTIHINDSMSGTLDVSFKDGALSAKVDASFDFNGVSFGFNFDLGNDLTDLNNLASVIENKILSEAASIFSSYFKDVVNYISAVGKGLLTGGEFVLNVIFHVYTKSLTDLFTILAKLPSGFHVNGTINFPIKIEPSLPSENVHVDLGPIVDTHSDINLFIHKFSEHADLSASTTIHTPSFGVTILDIDPSEHFDMVMPPSVDIDVTSPAINLDPHLDASLVGGSLGISGDVAVSGRIDLTNIDISADARINVNAHAGVHADIVHIGVHGDKNLHVDAGL